MNPLQNERQRLEHRRDKLKAAQNFLANKITALKNCESKIADAERPTAYRDPIFAGQLPRLKERRDELIRERDAAVASIEANYGDLIGEPAPVRDVRDQLIYDLQMQVAASSELIAKIRRGEA